MAGRGQALLHRYAILQISWIDALHKIATLLFVSRPTRRHSVPTTAEYQALAAFRHSLRKFLNFSSAAAKRVGLTGQHYQTLLALKASSRQGPLKVGELAAELLLRHHSAVELVDRLAKRGLVRRSRSTEDKRKVELRLTPKGESMIARLAATHHAELSQIGPQLRKALRSIGRQAKR